MAFKTGQKTNGEIPFTSSNGATCRILMERGSGSGEVMFSSGGNGRISMECHLSTCAMTVHKITNRENKIASQEEVKSAIRALVDYGVVRLLLKFARREGFVVFVPDDQLKTAIEEQKKLLGFGDVNVYGGPSSFKR